MEKEKWWGRMKARTDEGKENGREGSGGEGGKRKREERYSLLVFL